MYSNEMWKCVPGYNGFYEVSSMGRVRKVVDLEKEGDDRYEYLRISQSKSDTTHCNSSKYCYVNFGGKTFGIHRLVAEVFLPNPNNKRVVNHIDGNKGNNMLSNLEWATQAENGEHAVSLGIHSASKIVRCIDDGLLFSSFLSASAYYMIPAIVIQQCCKDNVTCFGKEFKQLTFDEVAEGEEMLYIAGSKLHELSRCCKSPEEVRNHFTRTLKETI